jgi:hypothetical protein
MLTAVATLAAIPLLVGAAGAGAWADLVIGQTVGTFVAVVAAWGWAVTGPTSVAAASVGERPVLYRRSLAARAVLAVPCLLAVVLVVPLLVDGPVVEAVLSGEAMVVGALGGTWYFVGAGDARRLLLLDTLPRAAGVLVGAVLVASGAPLLLAPVAQVLGALVAVLAAAGSARRAGWRESAPVRLTGVLASQSAGLLTAGASALYVALPLLVVSQVAPGAAPAFAVVDRLLRYGVLAAAPISGVAQSWVPSEPSSLLARARRARGGALLWGAAGAIAYAALGPLVGSLLTTGEVRLPLLLVLAYAAAAGCILASQVVGLAVLLSLGDRRALAVSTLLGLVLAAVLVPVGALTAGAVGAAAGLAVSELAVLLFQLGRTVRPLGRQASGPRSPRSVIV